MDKMIQQGGWIVNIRPCKVDDFLRATAASFAKLVPQEYEHSAHMWLENKDGRPAIRVQWERPMTDQELKVYGEI